MGMQGWALGPFFPRVAGRVRCTSCRPGPVEPTAGGLPGWDSVLALALSPGWSPRKKNRWADQQVPRFISKRKRGR